jgi:hypothetical protein
VDGHDHTLSFVVNAPASPRKERPVMRSRGLADLRKDKGDIRGVSNSSALDKRIDDDVHIRIGGPRGGEGDVLKKVNNFPPYPFSNNLYPFSRAILCPLLTA